MSSKDPSITIPSLRGGWNDNDPPMVLSEDSCTIAENIEFYYSTMGERRLGCTKVTDLPASITADANIQAITWMGRHLPTNDLTTAELWTLGSHLTASNNVLTRRTSTVWSTVTPNDAITVTSGNGHRLSAVSLHGKFFIAYKSSVDQLHVWDGTSLRKTGLAQAPSITTVANSGVGAFSGTRYYRIRYVVSSGTTILRRSEPGNTFSFTPSGAGDGLTITRPALLGQGETDWELEASTDNTNFYRILRLNIATASIGDTIPFGGYATQGVLSESLTSYTLIPSGKYLSVDSDRLLIAGSWENSAYASRVWWTPVFGNTGSGNDERLDMTVNPYVDLDGFEGGEITGISRAVSGYNYVFKYSHIYKLVRTGQRSSAYSAIPITKARGALPGSLVEAVDQTGSPAQYFLDPRVGPMRMGQYGLEWCGRDLRNTWSRINLSATVPAHGVFYQQKNQIHYWIALDGADYPNAKIVVQCNEMRSFSVQSYGTTSEGARRGWSYVPIGNRISDAHCSIMFDDNVSSVSARSQVLVPFIGKEQWVVGPNTIKDLVQQCDVGTTDALTTNDTAAYYYGKIKTKPFLPTGLLSKHGVMASSLLASTVSEPTNNVYVTAESDFGLETKPVSVDLSPSQSETMFVEELDNLSMATMYAVQFSFGDLNTNISPTTSWRLHAFSARVSPERSV